MKVVHFFSLDLVKTLWDGEKRRDGGENSRLNGVRMPV